MSLANDHNFDVMAVQYTYAPVDPYTDVVWLLSDEGWTKYVNDDVNNALALTQSLADPEQITAQYLIVDEHMQSDVPMISAYVISPLGAVSNRMENVKPNIFGKSLSMCISGM